MKTKLAAALKAIATEGDALESKADTIIALVAPLKDLDQFNEAVKEAYTANGWNAGPGEKGAGEGVPPTVKQYISTIRAAFRLGVNVVKARTMGALRKAVKAARPAKVIEPADPKLAGLRLVKSGEIINAPFHDLVVLYEALNKQKQQQLAGVVQRLVRQFQPAAVTQLRLAA
jgi:hypothetical protein